MNNLISQHNMSSSLPASGMGTENLQRELSPAAYRELMSAMLQGISENVSIGKVEGNVIADETACVPFPIDISYDYFNLFVIEGDSLRSRHFQMSPDRCICERYATEKAIAKWLKPLTRNEQAEIMKFPTIVANKTRRYNGEIDPLRKHSSPASQPLLQ